MLNAPESIAKIAGGAKMFNVPANSNLGNIGPRNIESVHQVLRQEGIRLLKEDVGGSAARTLFFDVATGEGTVKIYGNVERKLVKHNKKGSDNAMQENERERFY